jgi:hypothetical protein
MDVDQHFKLIVSQLQEFYVSMRARFDRLDARFDALDGKIDALRADLPDIVARAVRAALRDSG